MVTFCHLQVLERCCAILQEIPPHLRQKRSQNIAESLHHMCACLTYHMAKVLRMWGQRSLASNINQAARDLLSMDSEQMREVVAPASNAPAEEGNNGDTTETGSVTLTALKKKRGGGAGGGATGAVTTTGGGGGGRRGNFTFSSKEDGAGTGNEELKALEAHMLRLSKQGGSCKLMLLNA